MSEASAPVLYELAEEYARLLAILESGSDFEGTEEEFQQIAEMLADISEKLQQKAVNIAFVCGMLDANADQQEDQADRLEEYAKRYKAKAKHNRERAEWLRIYLMQQMRSGRIDRIDHPLATIRIGHSTAVDVYDASAIPPEYQRRKIEIEPDKIKLGAALKDGEVIPGARLVRRERLVIR